MNNQSFFYFFLFILLIGCSRPASEGRIDEWKAEIVRVEKAFNDMAQQEGLVKAFEFFAADDGVIRRGGEIIKGKEAISTWYQKDVQPDETLTWSPTFVDVSMSGDLAYTYGDFVFTYLDSLGSPIQNTGTFHTVWKRQADGDWKFVWD